MEVRLIERRGMSVAIDGGILQGAVRYSRVGFQASAASTYATYSSNVFGLLNGAYAAGPEGLGLVVGVKTAQHRLSVFSSTVVRVCTAA